MRERRRHDVLHREARFGRRARLLVVRDLHAGSVGADIYPLDVRGREAQFVFQRERAIDGGEGVAAAGVVLERHARDVEVAPEPGERLLPVGVVAHRAAEARFAFHHVERAGDAFARRERRGDARLGRAAGVQRLRHRVHAEGLLQSGGERGYRSESMGESLRVQLQQLGGGGTGPEAADGAGVVPVAVMRASHRGADARRDLIADDDGAQEILILKTQGMRGGNGRRAGVVDAVAIDIVDLDGMRRAAVDERQGARIAGLAERFHQKRRGRNDAAGQERGVPVDHGAPRVMRHFLRYRLRAPTCGPGSKALDDVHQLLYVTLALLMRAMYLGLCVAALTGAALAQEFPNRPVRIVVPWPPAGNVDITARTVAPALGDALGQQVIVENRAGAGGRIGTEAVAKSPADGYTLLLGSSGTITAGPAVWQSLSFDPLKDFVAIGPIQSVPIVLTVAPKTPASSYAEYVALAKARGGELSVASAGNGSSNHLAIELLMRQAGLKLLHVPYKGSGPALTDLIGSQVESMMDQLTASLGHIREGRIRALAITSLKRSPLLPEVPTLDELGVKGYEASTFTGIFVPAGVSQIVIDKLSTALRKALAVEAVRESYRRVGGDVIDMSRADFAAYVRADYEKWQRAAREGNIVVE